MNKLDYIVGTRYYKYDEQDNLIIFRIIKIKNENSFIARNETMGNTAYLNRKNLESCIRLVPDGEIGFSIVKLDKGVSRDVMITLHRTKDQVKGENQSVPYAVCRQNIGDFFSNIIRNSSDFYVGTSVSVDTCPPDIDFKSTLSCESVESMQLIAVYITDTLDDILKLIRNQSKYDAVLKSYKEKMEKLQSGVYLESRYIGFSTSLKELLETTQFMYDFYMAFGITKVDFLLSVINNCIYPDQLAYFIDIYKHDILNHSCVPYDKTIILSKISREYKLIRDGSDKMYVMVYDEGQYVNPSYSSLSDQSELDMIKKIKSKLS